MNRIGDRRCDVGEDGLTEMVPQLVGAPQVDPERLRCGVSTGAGAGQADDDALIQAEVIHDVVQLGHHVFLDRAVPGLALDRDPERRQRVAFLGQHVDLVAATGSTNQHLVDLHAVAVRREVRADLLLERSSSLRS